MLTEFIFGNNRYFADLSKPINISMPIEEGVSKAFHLPGAHYRRFASGDFTASVKSGGSCNVDEILLVPHGNGTHTECIGHITHEPQFISRRFDHFNVLGILITGESRKLDNGDTIVDIDFATLPLGFSALAVRTPRISELPENNNFSGSNPPYFLPETLEKVRKHGLRHLITDLPSVDRESDGGLMAAHKAFWGNEVSENENKATITELVRFPEDLADGLYFMQMATAPLMSDASPSTVLLYRLELLT